MEVLVKGNLSFIKPKIKEPKINVQMRFLILTHFEVKNSQVANLNIWGNSLRQGTLYSQFIMSITKDATDVGPTGYYRHALLLENGLTC